MSQLPVKKRALVTGGAGQDGWYLIELLRQKGYQVVAQSRRRIDPSLHGSEVAWRAGDLTDSSFLEDLLNETAADEIYNLAAVSRPAISWDIPLETAHLNALVPQQICEFIRQRAPDCRLFQASSSEIYGDSLSTTQDEETRTNPLSPYGISKAYAHQIVGAYRQQYGLHLSCGILFNHESPRRPLNFVSQKIAHAAAAVALGLTETRELDERGLPILAQGKLSLGDISVRRDFGFAGDVVEAMHLIVRHDRPADYAVGTGEAHSIADFCEIAFKVAGVDWKDHVVTDSSLVRKVDSHFTRADPSKLKSVLGWRSKVDFVGLVEMMVRERMRLLEGEPLPAGTID
ncbi:MAG: GDP-mannose 4,6-dehydratase [Rhodopseudomonas palustris]|uniref:GDP-mannose 4,6-dehydratase n=1 Tax=Rhodopseudomonas palustris TaxID=1076 RepID=A0A933S5M0_RHOPL|nr:GDP-mannose 4,6-dehydratase [Rhodopseudomonas palustris]